MGVESAGADFDQSGMRRRLHFLQLAIYGPHTTFLGGNMELRQVAQSEWQPLQIAGDSADRIRAKAVSLVGRLGELFNGKTTGGVSGLSIVPPLSGPVLALVTSPYGSARYVLEWHLRDKQPVGRLVLQRERFDEMDRTKWQAVWGIYVPADDGMYVEKNDVGVPVPDGLNSRYPDDLKEGLFEMGMITMLAIIKGPLIAIAD